MKKLTKWMLGAVVCASMFLSACAHINTNTCLIDAAIEQKKLEAASIKSEVVTFKYSFNGVMIGHAVVVFRVNSSWYMWDNRYGSFKIEVNGVSPDNIATEYLKKTQRKAYLLYAGPA
jgi:hypothetical protein